ncbi:hypothetical protein G6F46_004010 [Rhizopus delemar]|uniref:Homeobox domain-containing protein n=2 Tax=Rhizopus TaxID=4842 RepID=A0A9P6Z5Z7_9FUNG|nr:hypothetical protein G6F55_003601 [Rhizopus delemar]KAG1547096.1 hypothetical protein G6F51_004473 [Rhizopus arrhizus]KAG1499581.1 hypothetical protein G6F54_004315 [Rhizopus delemar]KAG1506210.1 hypothetical protein G6F52_011951 [Rhizopus delemar]KAG1513367.1 hypothetical protein G6F53_004483 [Rhizopus delemar]
MMPLMSDTFITKSTNNNGRDDVNYNNISQLQYTDMNDKRSSMLTPPPLPPPFVMPPLPFDGDMSRPRKRTRTTPEQLAVLEKSFSLNPSPNSRTREQLSIQLGMPERSIQIWFQNRRAKVKNQAKQSMQLQDKTLYMQRQYAANAAAAACQSAAVQQQHGTIDPELYNYYYYYYFQQIQQQHQLSKAQTFINTASMGSINPSFTTTVAENTNSVNSTANITSPTPISSSSFPIPSSMWISNHSSATPDLILSASTSSSSTTSDNRHTYKKHPTISSSTERTRAHSVGPYPYYHRNKLARLERHASLDPPASHHYQSSAYGCSNYITNNQFYNPAIMEESTTTNGLAAGSVKQIHHLTAETLQIGTWKRVCNLSCQINLSTHTLVWCIVDEARNQSFRMDIDLSLVQFIRMKQNGLEFFISSPEHIQFYMTISSLEREWTQCHDFTQDKQGSSENLHVLEGLSLGMELMEVLMQAPELQSLLIEDEEDALSLNCETNNIAMID